jgi:hypothetical protein
MRSVENRTNRRPDPDHAFKPRETGVRPAILAVLTRDIPTLNQELRTAGLPVIELK